MLGKKYNLFLIYSLTIYLIYNLTYLIYLSYLIILIEENGTTMYGCV